MKIKKIGFSSEWLKDMLKEGAHFNYKVIKGISEDAKLVHMKHHPENRTFDFFFEDETGEEVQETQSFESIDYSSIELIYLNYPTLIKDIVFSFEELRK